MPSRGSRDDPDEQEYRDEEASSRDASDTADREEDALSFMRVDEREDAYSGINETFSNPGPLKRAVVSRIPPRAIHAWEATVNWTKGPQPSRPWRITPLFEPIQTIPLQLLDRFCPKRLHRIGLLILFYFCWLLTFSLVLRRSAFASEVKGFGPPVTIGCRARFW
jgi:hypothetical protein